MSGYIGNIPVPQATQTRDVFTATSGQTSFATIGYTPGFLDVWLNGVKLVNGTDFTATNGSDVVLTSGAAASDIVEVLSYSTFGVNSQTFTGTTTLSGDLQATTATFSGAVTGTDLTLSGGVVFGATGGSVTSKTLDDYEEGTWVPTYNASGTDFSSITYNTTFTYGTYVKIGPLVNLRGYIRTEAITVGSASGGVRIGNLPFTSSSGINSTTDIRSRGSCIGDNFAASAPSCIAVDDGSSYANLYTLNAVGSATSHSVTPAASAMSTGTAKNITTFTITYYTDS